MRYPHGYDPRQLLRYFIFTLVPLSLCMSVRISDVVYEMHHTPCYTIVSEQLNPLSDADINISRCDQTVTKWPKSKITYSKSYDHV